MSSHLWVKVSNPGKKELQKFGFISAALVAGIFGLVLPWLFSHGFPLWPWIAAAILVVWAFVAPATLYVVYVPWMKFGGILGYVNTRILLGAVFYLLITPIGFLVRTIGSSNIRSHNTEDSSFRIDSHKPDSKHMEKPY